jgi:hypothetical protein
MECANCGSSVETGQERCPECGLAFTKSRGPLDRPKRAPSPVVIGERNRARLGRVVTDPTVVVRPRSSVARAVILALLILVLLLLLLRSPSALLGATLFPLLLLALVGLWLLRRIGLGLTFLAALARPRTGRGETPWLIFRFEDETGLTEVELEGHDHGIALGDSIAVSGVRRRGGIRAIRVENLTSRRTLYADRLFARAFSLLAIGALAIAIVLVIVR